MQCSDTGGYLTRPEGPGKAPGGGDPEQRPEGQVRVEERAFWLWLKLKQRPMGKKCPGPSGSCVRLGDTCRVRVAEEQGSVNQDWALPCRQGSTPEQTCNSEAWRMGWRLRRLEAEGSTLEHALCARHRSSSQLPREG